jgi:hypothetical protein
MPQSVELRKSPGGKAVGFPLQSSKTSAPPWKVMTDNDIDRLKLEIDLAARRNIGLARSPDDLAAMMVKDLEKSLDSKLATVESIKVVEEDRDESLIREVMEEPLDEFKLEMSLRMFQPIQYIRCCLIIKP